MAVTLIANTGKGSADATNPPVTDPIDTTGANFLVVWCATTATGVNQNITDSKGNTWTALTAEQVGGGERGVLYIATAPVLVGSGHTFTSSDLGALVTLCVAAFATLSSSPTDQQSGSNTFGTTLQPGSITPSQDDELVIQGNAFNLAGTVSINLGYTITDQVDRTANHMGGAVAYLVQVAAGATNPTWTNSTAVSQVARSASFKVGVPPTPEVGVGSAHKAGANTMVFGI